MNSALCFLKSLLPSVVQLDGFFSGMGGSLSLYLGIAVTMAFEILELLFDLVSRAFRNNQQME